MAALFVGSCVVAILFVWRAFGGTLPLAPHGFVLNAAFDQAANLADNEDVRIAGVPVGKVIKVTPHAGLTDAEMALDSRYAPPGVDARAVLRSKTLLGENFVEIDLGSPSAPRLREGGWLRSADITPTQQIDQVLSAFDAPTRDAFRRLMTDNATVLANNGENLNAALGNADPSTQALQQVLAVLDAQGADVRTLVHDSARALHATAARSADLRRLIVSGSRVLSATAARNTALTDTVRALPPFLGRLHPALDEVQRTAVAAAPTLHVLRPVAPLVRPALREVSHLAPQAAHLMRDLRPLLRTGPADLRAGTRVVDAIRALAPVLDASGRQLVPVVQLLGLYKRDVLAATVNLAAATEATTPLPAGGSQHYLRVMAQFNNEGAQIASQRLPTNRYNPYPAPGALSMAGGAPIAAFDCRNTSNPATLPVLAGAANPGAPPCVTAQPWVFQGAARSYPHVEAFRP